MFQNFNFYLNCTPTGILVKLDHEEEKLKKKKKSLEQMEPFNPEPIITAILKMVKEDKMTIVHLQSMITFGLVRGFGGNKTWATIYNRSSYEGRRRLQTAVDFLSVKLGRQSRKDTLTVPRLMQSFPKLTWNLHCAVVIKGIYVEKAEKAGYNGSLPMCLRYSGSPGVMGPDVWDTYRNEYCSFSMALGRLWKSGQSSEEIERFAELSYECLAIKPDERITMEMVKEAEAQIERSEKYKEANKVAADVGWSCFKEDDET